MIIVYTGNGKGSKQYSGTRRYHIGKTVSELECEHRCLP